MRAAGLGVLTVVLLVLLLVSSPPCHAAVVLTSVAPAYSQDFDTLATSGVSSTLPADWYFHETGANADATYFADDGTTTSGNTYSFGTGTSTERALGTLLSGLSTPDRSTIGAEFQNGGDAEIIALQVNYRGEEWRLGAVLDPPRQDRLDFEFSTNATSFTDALAVWSNHDALDFSTPVTTGTDGAKNGNAAGFNTAVSSTITSLSIPPSATFWIRWTDFNASASDDGLAVDDFTITATFAAVPEPGAVLFGGAVCGVIGLAVSGRRLVAKLKARTAA